MRGVCGRTSSLLALLFWCGMCSGTALIEGGVRLVPLNATAQGNRPVLTGRLEIFHAGQWGTVCDDFFDFNDARVACRQLGFAGALRVLTAAKNGHQWSGSGPIWLDDVACKGTESTLVKCMSQMSDWGDNNCGHDEDIALTCQDTSAKEGDVRLLGGKEPNFGCVQVFHEYSWGTVCSSRWTESSANVICRQLGYKGVQQYLVDKSSAMPKLVENMSTLDLGRVWVDELNCVGTEATLMYCNLLWGTMASCGHDSDVILWCDPGQLGTGSDSDSTSWTYIVFPVTAVLLCAALTAGCWKLRTNRRSHVPSASATPGLDRGGSLKLHAGPRETSATGSALCPVSPSPDSLNCADDAQLLTSTDGKASWQRSAPVAATCTAGSGNVRPISVSDGTSTSSGSEAGSAVFLISQSRTSGGSPKPSPPPTSQPRQGDRSKLDVFPELV